MAIQIKIKDTGKTPAVGIGGSLSYHDERQLQALGFARRSKDWSKEQEQDYWWMGKPNYEVPLPLIKRLFEVTEHEDLITSPPDIIQCRDWREYILPSELDDEDTQANNDLRLKLHNFWIDEEVVKLYEKFVCFEKTILKLRDGDQEIANSILEAWEIEDDWWARKPRDHQKIGMAFFLFCIQNGIRHAMLFDEMRTGKTLQAINISKFLIENGLIKQALILVPNSIKYVWAEELTLDAPIHGRFQIVVSGSRAEKHSKWSTPSFYKITNYETARADYTALYDWAQSINNEYMLIADEAHKIKNPDSQISKVISKLNPKYSLYMTGTPVANRPEDAWAMSNNVCPALLGANIHEFKSRFAIMGGYTGKDITGYKDLSEVRYRLERLSLRRLRKDIIINEVVRQTITEELDGYQKTAYEEMRDMLYTEALNDTGEMTALKCRNKMVQSLRLTQICDGYLQAQAGQANWLKDNWKFQWLDEFIDEYLDEFGKIVIWTRFDPPIKKLYEKYSFRYDATFINGSISDPKERAERMYKFQNNPDCRIMIGQILSASVGLGFQPATTAIFLDKWWSPALNKQAEDRIAGQENVQLNMISLVSKDTIDERWEFILNRKKDWAATVTGDAPEEYAVPIENDKDLLLYLLAPAKDAEKYKEKLENKWK